MTQAYLQGPREQGKDISMTDGWTYSRARARAGTWWLFHSRVSVCRGTIWGYTHSFITRSSWRRG